MDSGPCGARPHTGPSLVVVQARAVAALSSTCLRGPLVTCTPAISPLCSSMHQAPGHCRAQPCVAAPVITLTQLMLPRSCARRLPAPAPLRAPGPRQAAENHPVHVRPCGCQRGSCHHPKARSASRPQPCTASQPQSCPSSYQPSAQHGCQLGCSIRHLASTTSSSSGTCCQREPHEPE